MRRRVFAFGEYAMMGTPGLARLTVIALVPALGERHDEPRAHLARRVARPARDCLGHARRTRHVRRLLEERARLGLERDADIIPHASVG